MESNEIQRNKMLKMNFLKQTWYSVTKFEKYPEMAAVGLKKSLLYFTKLMIIFSIICTITVVYCLYNSEKGGEENSLSVKLYNIALSSVPGEQDEIFKNASMDEVKEMIQNYSDGYTIFAIFIVIFTLIFGMTLIRIILLSVFGLITCFFAQIKINYKALFNMSIYAMTLSILLHIIYTCIILLTDFKVKYFDILYVSVSYISLAAAIFIIKSNVIKTHLELMKIIDSSKQKIEETIRNKQNKDDQTDDKEKENNETKENDKENESDDNSSEDGINA